MAVAGSKKASHILVAYFRGAGVAVGKALPANAICANLWKIFMRCACCMAFHTELRIGRGGVIDIKGFPANPCLFICLPRVNAVNGTRSQSVSAYASAFTFGAGHA